MWSNLTTDSKAYSKCWSNLTTDSKMGMENMVKSDQKVHGLLE